MWSSKAEGSWPVPDLPWIRNSISDVHLHGVTELSEHHRRQQAAYQHRKVSLNTDLGRDGTPSQQFLWKAVKLAKICVSLSIFSGDYAFHSMFDSTVSCVLFQILQYK